MDPTEPVCDIPNNVCVACVTNADCVAPGVSICDNNVCVACLTSADCVDPVEPVCDNNVCRGNKKYWTKICILLAYYFHVLPYDNFTSVSNHLFIGCQDDSECTDPTKPHCILGSCTGNKEHRNQ